MRRLPGQSVRDERDRILNDHVLEYLIGAIALCLLAAWEWMRRWLPLQHEAEVVSAMALGMTAYCAFRMVRLRKEIRNLNQAEKGERRVAELLTQLRRLRCVAFHDLVQDGFNIDHVLVGPGGIFAIETKTYSVFGDGHVGISSEGNLELSGKLAHGDPIKQAKGVARTVSQEIRRILRRDYWVQPVIMFPGWGVNTPKKDVSVVVLNDELLPEFVASVPRVFDDAEISEICSHLDLLARS